MMELQGLGDVKVAMRISAHGKEFVLLVHYRRISLSKSSLLRIISEGNVFPTI
jgi:hypothetical protein